jgi:hypothetical protein
MASITSLPLKASRPASEIAASAAVAEHRQDEQLAVRGGLSERAGLDAGSVTGEPFAQVGLSRLTRADHHVVATTAKPSRQPPPDLAAPLTPAPVGGSRRLAMSADLD